MKRRLERLADALVPGARVFVSTLSGESALLAAELRDDPERAREVDFTGVQFPGIDTLDYLALHPAARQSAFFMSPGVRKGLAERRATLSPLDYRGIARWLRDKDTEFDVAIAQLTPPDAEGFCSPGICADFMPLAWHRAKRRIAHINPRMPRTEGSFRVPFTALDGYIEADAPLLAYADPEPGTEDRAIVAHAAGLIDDGDTLQFGIGTVPLALAGALTSHRRLRLHTGMVTRSARLLFEAGALDAAAPVITGVALGDEEFYRFVAGNRRFRFVDVGETHDAAALGQVPRLVAVNGAVEVDLFGQVNSESVGGKLLAGAGGLPAFAQGALNSPGGRSLICLRASAAGGSISRIVPRLGDGVICTLPRWFADVVVTEHGVARIRNLDMDARAEALIAIAAPQHRAGLIDAWAAMRAKA